MAYLPICSIRNVAFKLCQFTCYIIIDCYYSWDVIYRPLSCIWIFSIHPNYTPVKFLHISYFNLVLTFVWSVMNGALNLFLCYLVLAVTPGVVYIRQIDTILQKLYLNLLQLVATQILLIRFSLKKNAWGTYSINIKMISIGLYNVKNIWFHS